MRLDQLLRHIQVHDIHPAPVNPARCNEREPMTRSWQWMCRDGPLRTSISIRPAFILKTELCVRAVLAWVGDPRTVYPGELCQVVWGRVRGSHDVLDLGSARRERIGHKRTVAAPRYRLRTHQRDRAFSRQR